MIRRLGFDTDKYLLAQSRILHARVKKFDRLYLEFGGKLVGDFHAHRTLPGYRANAKIELLKKLGKISLFYCVCAKDLSNGRIRGDSGLTYDLQVIKDLDQLNQFGLTPEAIIITRLENEPSATALKRKLEYLGYKVATQKEIDGYPDKIENILSGYRKQPYVPPNEKLVVVTGAGGGSGKMAFCLSQICFERKRGIKSGFAKFETFPVWNLSINHPVNIAYEAATADIQDVNQVDPFHKKAYSKVAVNYNRDIENYSILVGLLQKITGEKIPFGYKSPTDMGINMARAGIVNDKVCRSAAKEEIIRRNFRYLAEKAEGKESASTLARMEELMKKSNLCPEMRKVVLPARNAELSAKRKGKGCNGVYSGAAIGLETGEIVTGKSSPILTAASAAVINVLKILAKIPDEIDLISYSLLKEVSSLKKDMINRKTPNLSLQETLIALASSATLNPSAKVALSFARDLSGAEIHITSIPCDGDKSGCRSLGLNLTFDC